MNKETTINKAITYPFRCCTQSCLVDSSNVAESFLYSIYVWGIAVLINSKGTRIATLSLHQRVPCLPELKGPLLIYPWVNGVKHTIVKEREEGEREWVTITVDNISDAFKLTSPFSSSIVGGDNLVPSWGIRIIEKFSSPGGASLFDMQEKMVRMSPSKRRRPTELVVTMMMRLIL